MAWREPIGLVVGASAADPVSIGGAAPPLVNSGWKEPLDSPFCDLDVEFVVAGEEIGGKICEGCTSTGSQPPGACVIFASSRPSRRGIEGPVRSISRMPTEWPARERESASWIVMEDLPTPPLPERTCGREVNKVDVRGG